MYKPFIQASNLALDGLSKLSAPGLVCSKAHDDDKILFHQNDPRNITQKHQGEKSTRRPDVVIVSYTSAKKVRKQSDRTYKDQEASEKPTKQFQWTDVRSTVEFKHQKNWSGVSTPPATYAAKAYDVPEAMKYMKYQRETNGTAEATGSAPLPGSGAAASSRQSRGLNKKRGSSQAPDGHSSKVDDQKEPPKSRTEPERIHPVLQNGLYAAELFAAHIVRQSAITYVVNNDMIYPWYFDRQDAIQCSGINFVQDLPRFMVLLLAIQRMPYAEWGYNRVFEPKPGSSDEVWIPDEDIGEVDLTFDLKSDKRTTHFGLCGRATTVFPLKSEKLLALVPTLPHHNPHNPTNELVAKLYWPEEECESEPAILQKVYEIAKKDEEGKVKHHVPEMVWFHQFEDTSTAKIRKTLGLKDAERGSRVLYIIVFRKLAPITDLSDTQFLTAWWHIVVCHYTLWGKNVHHRDVSPSNLMIYKTLAGRYIGVLNDFDLSSTRDTPSGQERTGTVPFMALDLLTKEGIEGKVKHLYQHDAESFIWVLTWICLRYGEGELLRQGRPLDEWLQVDAITCHDKKGAFLVSGRRKIKPSPSHKHNWRVARSCLRPVGLFYLDDPETDDSEAEGLDAKDYVSHTLTDAVVFETWLEQKVHGVLSPELLDVRVTSTS
ncbi:hypothetical protein BDR05DRAFT_805008 [Suillus weaverae]|nr:hypothetical protein BDR05DRAFT_805008 [Suillus weaverae]